MMSEELAIRNYVRQPLPTLRDIFAVIFRKRWAMLIAFIVVVIAVAVSGVWIPKYEAEMKILVRHQRSDTILTTSATSQTQFNNDEVSEEELNSEVELLNSVNLLRNVVLVTGLAGPHGAGENSEVQIARAVRKLSKDLKIGLLRKTDVISVRLQADDPQRAAKVLGALAAEYTKKHLEMHRSGELSFFNQQTEQYKEGMEQAQAKLTDFTKRTGVVSAEIERDSALRQANEFDAAARQTQTSLLETEQRIRTLQGQLQSMKPRMTTIVRTADNPQLLQQLKSTLLELELKKTELLRSEEHT